jgi:LPS-assembly lipoprotein
MARIDVETPNTRAGYLLREQLEDAFAWDRSQPPAYRLVVKLDERRRPRGLDESRVATRYEVTLTASYVLTDVATNRMVLRGNRPIHVTYDTTDQPYAGIVAQQDGQVRAAGQAAEQIKTDLLAWFAEQ